MEGLDETLCARVDAVIRAHKSQLLSTTGPQAAIGELVTRSEGLEKALREIALEVQKLAAFQNAVSAGRTPKPSAIAAPSFRQPRQSWEVEK